MIHEIKLNTGEMIHLLASTYIYDWVINSITLNSDEKIDSHCNNIYKILYENGFDDFIDKTDNDIYLVNKEYEEEFRDYIKNYNEESFWPELSAKLGRWTFLNKYSEHERDQLSQKDHFLKQATEICKWEDKLETYGIECLVIKNETI